MKPATPVSRPESRSVKPSGRLSVWLPQGIRWRENRGQGTVEWVGLLFLVVVMITGLLAAGIRLPGTALIHSVSRQMLCAASLSAACGKGVTLESSYGEQLAAEIRSHTPDLLYGRDLLGLPVDYRTCRSAHCADAPGPGPVTESTAGEPVTLFTRVLDCRDGSDDGDAGGDGVATTDCSGDRDGRLFIQYWAYYPESASLRGAPVLESKGYHRHDWESVQVRVDPDGAVSQRASSHAGYNHTRSSANWGSDMGSGMLTWLAESAGVRNKGGWGEQTGRYLIAGGSHAGNVAGPTDHRRYPSYTPARNIRLVPLERTHRDALSRPARFDPIMPPWSKQVWRDPEAEGTG